MILSTPRPGALWRLSVAEFLATARPRPGGRKPILPHRLRWERMLLRGVANHLRNEAGDIERRLQ